MQLEHQDLAVRDRARPPLEQPGPQDIPPVWSPAGELVLSRERREVQILSLAGELNLTSAPAISRELHAAEETRPARVVVDLSGLVFMDSSGLHELLRARASASSHRLSLRRGPPACSACSSSPDRLFSFED